MQTANQNAMFSSYDEEQLYKPRLIRTKDPVIGCKIICIEERGMFVLEEGATAIHGIACTHAGSGGFIVYDGVPDDNGFFEFQFEPSDCVLHNIDPVRLIDDPGYRNTCEDLVKKERNDYNGRRIIPFYCAVMGMWMFNGGLYHGLTILNRGEMRNVVPIITVTWSKAKVRA